MNTFKKIYMIFMTTSILFSVTSCLFTSTSTDNADSSSADHSRPTVVSVVATGGSKTVTITFSENVVLADTHPESGFTAYTGTDDTISTFSGTENPATAATVQGKTVSLTLTDDLTTGEFIIISMSVEAGLKDTAGNPYGGDETEAVKID